MSSTLDESTGTPSAPSPLAPTLRLGFRPATLDDPPSTPLPHPASSPENLPPLDLDEPSGSADGWDEPNAFGNPDGTSSPGSSPDGEPLPELLDDTALRDMARAGVAIAGHQAHEHLTRTDGQRQVGLFLTDQGDQSAIGDPLARIAARHQGIGKVNPDTKDLLASMIGLANYATKQITLAKHAKGLDLAGDGTPQPMPPAVDL